MSLYTTGELAKKCNVSVRTIQYYDERGILVPTDLTEGGRRLFSEEDVATLETICFLRDMDISIKDIAEILESDESKKVIELLLDEQAKNIQADIKRKTEQLEKINDVRSSLTSSSYNRYPKELSAAESVWLEKQVEVVVNDPDESTWQSLPGGDTMNIVIKRNKGNDISLRGVKPIRKYSDLQNELEYLAQYGSISEP